MSKKTKIIIISVVAVLGIGGFVGINAFNSNNNKGVIEEQAVELYTIPGKEKIFLNGKIVPRKSETFSTTNGFGELDKISIEDGQGVKKGDILFSLKNVENINEVENLKKQASRKQKDINNAQDEESKAMLKEELDDLNSQIADLNKKSYKTIYAPFDGNVYIQDSMGSGDSESEGMSQGKSIILETTDYYITTQANEMEVVKLAVDQDVEIQVTATKKKATGKISEVSQRPVAGGDTQGNFDGGGMSFANFPIKVSVENQENLRNGFGVQVTAMFGTNENKLPISAVFEEEGKFYIYSVTEDIANKIEVAVKEQTDEFYIVEGLAEGLTLVRDINNPNIADGQNIYGAVLEEGSSDTPVEK